LNLTAINQTHTHTHYVTLNMHIYKRENATSAISMQRERASDGTG